MIHNVSARSFNTVSSQRSHGTELSQFERILPQAPEFIEPQVPRGMRFALGTASELAGHGKMAKVLEHAGATYSLTVRPNARRNMIKESLKFDDPARPATSNIELPEVRFNDTRLDAIIDERHSKSVFRKERLHRFTQHRWMPALVTERLVPSWKAEAHGKDANEVDVGVNKLEADRCQTAPEILMPKKKKGRRRDQHNKMMFVSPTMSVAMKRQPKVEVPPRGWQPNGVLDVHEALHPKVLVFESGGTGPIWEELERERTREHALSKRRWLAHDILPGGIALPTEVQEIREEVEDIREDSKRNLESLRSKYEQRRTQHKKHNSTKRGDSAFEKYFREHKVKQKIAAEAAEREAALEENRRKTFGLGGLGIGLLGPGRQQQHEGEVASFLRELG